MRCSQIEAGEQFLDPALGHCPVRAHQFGGHVYVLERGERFKQVVRLEDEPDLFAQVRHLLARDAQQFLPQQLQASFLDAAECPDQRQQRGFARPGRTGHDDDLAALYVQTVVEENLFARFAFAKIVVQVLHADHAIRARHASQQRGGRRGRSRRVVRRQRVVVWRSHRARFLFPKTGWPDRLTAVYVPPVIRTRYT